VEAGEKKLILGSSLQDSITCIAVVSHRREGDEEGEKVRKERRKERKKIYVSVAPSRIRSPALLWPAIAGKEE
jgi:hypothetical protein